MGKIKDTLKRLSQLRHKVSSRDTVLFVFFVIMAAIFWMMLTFNNQMTHDVTVEVKVKKPANVTFIQDIPPSITMTVKDRGIAFMKLYFRSTPSIELDFNKYSDDKTKTMVVTTSQLMNELRRTMRREATIQKVQPESLNVKYTTLPGKKVPVNWEDNLKNITTDWQFVINPDGVTTIPDSVMVYAIDRATLAGISEVDITTIEVENLTSTLNKSVRIKQPANARAIPGKVELRVPVESLIKKELNIPISVRNQPYGINVLLFPATVKVSYLLPQSKYKLPANITVVVDYNDIDLSSNRVNVKLGEVSGSYTNVSLGTDSVNYVIERY